MIDKITENTPEYIGAAMSISNELSTFKALPESVQIKAHRNSRGGWSVRIFDSLGQLIGSNLVADKPVEAMKSS